LSKLWAIFGMYRLDQTYSFSPNRVEARIFDWNAFKPIAIDKIILAIRKRLQFGSQFFRRAISTLEQ